MAKLGLIARSDNTGLGNQTLNLARLLNPDKIMLIDSTSFNGNTQHPEKYANYNVVITTNGFPSNEQCKSFVNGLDTILTAETFYNLHLPRFANDNLVKSYTQYNYEFMDYMINKMLPMPYGFLAPSHWHTDKVKQRFRRVEYLPPPLFSEDFAEVRKTNFNRTGKRRFLHIIGKAAAHDRNGTSIIIEALKHTTADFELVIKVQHDLLLNCDDPRVTIDKTDLTNYIDVYSDYDAILLPRRYGGLCLPMNEGLMAGLPVIMPRISPNTMILPRKWQLTATRVGSFKPRTVIDIYQASDKALASRIDWLCSISDEQLKTEKQEAFEIAKKEYEAETLLPRYKEVLCL